MRIYRAIYRTIELADGWSGPVLRTQWPFSSCRIFLVVKAVMLTSVIDVFDGAMVVIAFYTINFLHPGYLLPEQSLVEKANFISQVYIPLTKQVSPSASDV